VNGQSSSQPHVFGEALLEIGRETEARQLFDLSVRRGAICHPLQRPEMLLRKDLAAQSFWALPSSQSSESTPRSTSATPPVVPPLFVDLLDAFHPILASAVTQRTFVFSGESMSSFVESGSWERTVVYGDDRWQEFNCLQFGEVGCDLLHQMQSVLSGSNDGYRAQCNHSLVMEIWRLAPGTTSRRAVGPSNIVLQLVSAVESGSGKSLVLAVGSEAMKLEEGERVVMDDSFENVLRVVAEEDDADDDKLRNIQDSPLVALHIQICHPELHDKAFSEPSRRCRHP